MTYNEIMQKPGKMISTQVLYNTTVIGHDDIISAKPYFNANIVGTIMKGLKLELKQDLPNNTQIYFKNNAIYGSNIAYKTYGPYYLYKSEYNADNKTYSCELYDNILTTMVDYKPITITYPCTVLEFFQQLVLELGFTTNISSLPNGSREIGSDIYENIGFTFRDVLNDIGQATASLFYLDGNEIKKATLGTTTITINDDILRNQNIDFGEHYGPINVITLTRSADADGIYYPSTLPSEIHEFKITDNQLMNDNNRDEYLPELYNALNGIEYDIFDVELVGYGVIDPLQKVNFETGNNTYSSYIFNNEEEFSKGYKQSLYTELPEESTTEYKKSDTTDKRFKQVYIIANKQQGEINSLVSDVNDQGELINQVATTQTAQQLSIDILSTNIDETGEITSVKTTEGFTFNNDGLNITKSDTTYNTQINNEGTYYKDGTTIVAQTTKDGSKFKDMDLFGTYRYGKNSINDEPMFIAQLYTDVNDEECFGHFYNGG